MGSNGGNDPRMPKVGSVIPHPTTPFTVIKVLATGPFSDVFVVKREKDINDNTKPSYAMKVERQRGNLRPVLKIDVYVLTHLGQKPGFTELITAYHTKYYKYAVMQFIGPDLNRLRRAMPNKCFSPATALRVSIEALKRIEALHDIGMLNRDVKAPNFAIGVGDKMETIYMLDFGFARKYKDKNFRFKPPRPAAAMLGTIHYASIATHQFKDQCRRDDVESWVYMIVEMYSGALPWCNLKPLEEHKKILEYKEFVRYQGRDMFFAKCPKEFDTILSDLDRLQFTDRPNYQMYYEELEKAMKRLKLDMKEPMDWMKDGCRLQEKAKFVGELGESNAASVLMHHEEEERVFNHLSLGCDPTQLENSFLSTGREHTPKTDST